MILNKNIQQKKCLSSKRSLIVIRSPQQTKVKKKQLKSSCNIISNEYVNACSNIKLRCLNLINKEKIKSKGQLKQYISPVDSFQLNKRSIQQWGTEQKGRYKMKTDIGEESTIKKAIRIQEKTGLNRIVDKSRQILRRYKYEIRCIEQMNSRIRKQNNRLKKLIQICR